MPDSMRPDSPDAAGDAASGRQRARQGDAPDSGRSIRGPLVVLGIFALLATLTFGAVVMPTLAASEQPELPIYGTMPAFQLTDQTGATLTDDALRGHVVVANFIFTRCPTVCPLFSMKMRGVQERTADIGGMVKLLSFSVDPDYDTPEVLAAYAREHGAEPARWRFLTGASEDIRRIATEGLMLAMDQAGSLPSGAPNIIHGEHFVLLDHALRIRGYYSSHDAKRIERMLRDARHLERKAREARQGAGAER